MYDKNSKQLVRFVGGPFDGKDFSIVPAHQLTLDQKTDKGVVLKRHVYNLREYVDETTGEVVKLEYIYKP